VFFCGFLMANNKRQSRIYEHSERLRAFADRLLVDSQRTTSGELPSWVPGVTRLNHYSFDVEPFDELTFHACQANTGRFGETICLSLIEGKKNLIEEFIRAVEDYQELLQKSKDNCKRKRMWGSS
jgi:hypothetical protein